MCEAVIPKGQWYAAGVVPVRSVPIVREFVNAGMIDPSGNLWFDFCLECRLQMALEKEAIVN